MGREVSSSNTTSPPVCIEAKRLPPWENSDVPRAPHMSASAPALSKEEVQALPALWATTSKAAYSPSREQESPLSSPSQPSRTGTGSFSRRDSSLADSAQTTSPQPSEDKFMIPAYEKAYEPAPAADRHPVVALPGTMSSRANHSRSRVADPRHSADKRQHRKGSQNSNGPAKLGHRFTSVVKELFRRGPIDDNQLEHIEERHWSEE